MPSRKIVVAPPTRTTLGKYGMTVEDWSAIVARQKGVCPVCGQPFGARKLAIDHEHVAGFKARKRRKGKKKVAGKRVGIRVRVMAPEVRKIHVRGILHSFCNRYVRGWLTLARAAAILRYLEAHERRKLV